ncbi:hypothetical protein PsYK624_049250 [Phanerochaete sordida]|uniref:Uncharacterized protein n=1 Tax=Phanerochaete sordida TaxID=48140 RepID=A0A9P3G5V4_9APHY|nr:hypothetical protein PsYK624_049250 [Phanerochaete sordida]
MSGIIPSPPPKLGKRARGSDSINVDYTKPIPYPPSVEAVEAMRLRILQLENELRAVKKQKTTPAQQTTLPGAGPSKATAAPAERDAKADAKLVKSRTKSLFDQIKKAAKAEKYHNVDRVVKVEEHFSQGDFDLVFGSSGRLVQPTAANKPTSKVWIKKYSTDEELQALFGANWKPDQLKGDQWSVGNIFVGKGQKLGQVQLKIYDIEVQWSQNTGKAVLKVDISEEHRSDYGFYDGW